MECCHLGPGPALPTAGWSWGPRGLGVIAPGMTGLLLRPGLLWAPDTPHLHGRVPHGCAGWGHSVRAAGPLGTNPQGANDCPSFPVTHTRGLQCCQLRAAVGGDLILGRGLGTRERIPVFRGRGGRGGLLPSSDNKQLAFCCRWDRWEESQFLSSVARLPRAPGGPPRGHLCPGLQIPPARVRTKARASHTGLCVHKGPWMLLEPHEERHTQ